MIKLICDRCGAEIKDQNRIGYVSVNYRLGIDGELTDENPFEYFHFCPKCITEITSFATKAEEEKKPEKQEVLTGWVEQIKQGEQMEPSEEPEPEQKKARGTKRGRKGSIDHGKVLALFNAGWSHKAISEEMNISLDSVRNSLYMTRKRMKEGRE